MSEFLDMGKHAVFIWSAYGLSGALIVFLALRSRSKFKASEEQVAAARARRKGGV